MTAELVILSVATVLAAPAGWFLGALAAKLQARMYERSYHHD